MEYVLFPCYFPHQPCMRSIERRTLTFLNNAKSWVMFEMNVSFCELAEAGWCYTGDKDRVKCWYCSGILQQWRVNDDPWEEHAKWFPLCEYILQRKGGDYVFGVVSRFPNLRRPNISNPANVEEIERIRRMLPRSTPAGEILMRSLREDDELQIVREREKCVVCFTHATNALIIPCGHLCMCLECVVKVQTCPMCRTEIYQTLKVYRV
ncbi:unnamed protein product [Clavelina lepadiformis]|uniref:RING-type domain-containing protein n=1 Tax=Clavelina lepadiformis TaxID=159417 RepID=A0ABP0H5Y4_CLALP